MRFRAPREKGKRAMLSCARYPDCRGVRWFDEKGALEEPKAAPVEAGVTCVKCGRVMLKRQARNSGKFFLSCSGWRSDGRGCDGPTVWLDELGRPLPPRAVEHGPACRECGAPTVKRGPASNGTYFWACTKWRSDGTGCNARPIWINQP
jgi:ssDNA-binding Zn-finger/Zn-ribbon topoisomerase 1